jgi:Zn-finger nucleic acid-binding protein
MDCPKCNGGLVEVVRHGVVIDSCTGCSGIWLDKGEMSKIINQIKQAEASLMSFARFSVKRRTTMTGTGAGKNRPSKGSLASWIKCSRSLHHLA